MTRNNKPIIQLLQLIMNRSVDGDMDLVFISKSNESPCKCVIFHSFPFSLSCKVEGLIPPESLAISKISFSLSAMASISQYASRPFDTFVLIMEPNSRQFDTEKIEAKAKRTIDYFVFKRVKKDRWSEKCISIERI